ncbi:MAG: uncharacterized membrane-anchored protein YitT (DUF2179 family) [Sulfurimonas sp.]|uniref:YitT family protein n=1 Tax=Sulfurimonas sp. TaxID=2022749 RepID=UPI0039E32B2E
MINIFATLPINKELLRYISIFIGATLLAIGVVMFLIPNQIVSGGTPGISILINNFTGIPTGMIMFIINVPLVLMSIKYIGKGFTIRTIFSIATSSFMVDFFREYLQVTAWTNEPILAGIFGGIAIGLGLGFIIAGNASAGGPSIVARIVADKMHWKQGNVIIALDILIVLSAGVVFESVESALWSLISVYTTARSMDMLISGRPTEKVIHISSNKVELLSEHIIEKFGKEGIILNGLGFDQREKRKLMMLVIENNKIPALRAMVEKHDPDGFLVIIEASELLGRGH